MSMPVSPTAAEAMKVVQPGDRNYIHSVAAAPQHLIEALVARAPELYDVEIVHLHTEGKRLYVKAPFRESFCLHSFFVGAMYGRLPRKVFPITSFHL